MLVFWLAIRSAAARMTAHPDTPQLCSCPQPMQARLPVSTFNRRMAFTSS